MAMASRFFLSSNLFFPLLLIVIVSLFPSISSLSTIAISETSNQTLICASSQSQAYLKCRSFPGDQSLVHTNINSKNISVSGIVAGHGFVCGLVPSNSVSQSIGCWRFNNSNNGTIDHMSYHLIHHGSFLSEFEAGNRRVCGLHNRDNRLECWQPHGFNDRNDHNFTSIAVGDDFVCGLNEVGKITCLEEHGNSTRKVVGFQPDEEHYSAVAAGFRHACAIRINGSLNCWGAMNGHDVPGGEFKALALGENRSCGLRPNQTVKCWGENNFSLPDNLRSTNFILIEAKRRVFCGLLVSDYSLHCWGNDNFDSNFKAFENVLPGQCVSTECSCGMLPGSGSLCDSGLHICQPCLNTPHLSPPPDNSIQPLSPPSESSASDWNTKMVIFLVIGCLGSLGFVLVASFFLYRHCCKCKGSRVHDSGPLDENGRADDEERQLAAAVDARRPVPLLQKRLSQLLSTGNGSRLEEFSFEYILKVTNNFSQDQKIGWGSFGSVFHAVLDDGREVAIKRAESSSVSTSNAEAIVTKLGQEEDIDNSFLNEVDFLSRLNHKNLVKLFGFAHDQNERVLVYEYMNNHTLHYHLHNRNNVSTLNSWETRIRVALDVARGIEYLHVYANPPIIHRDIKSSNILLSENWSAKVSDFGLSLLGPRDDETHLSLHAAGTVGYVDPEYYRLHQLSSKSDVYSFGIVLLELLCGYKAIHSNENGSPRNVVDLVVPYIVKDEIHRILDREVAPPTPVEIEAVAYVGYLAADCVTLEGRHRPSMTNIVNSLERALAACLEHPVFSGSSTTTTSSSSTIKLGPQN